MQRMPAGRAWPRTGGPTADVVPLTGGPPARHDGRAPTSVAMPRLAPALLVLIVVAHAGAAPRLKEKKADAPPLAGTSWAGKTAEGWDMTIDFAADGKMTVAYNGTSYNRASWKQDGDKV